jgi:hypothetical protein
MAPAEIYLFSVGSVNCEHWREVAVEVVKKTLTVCDDLWRSSTEYDSAEKKYNLLRAFHR